MAENSIARAFFEDILKAEDKAAFVRGLVRKTDPVFETEWLDFKSVPAIEGNNGGDVQKTWSKALSGFSNTGGGVLVWGIDARKDKKTNIDCASDILPVDNPAGLRTRLMELHHQATDPPVQGIDVRPIDDPSTPGKGFVVCFIPESRSRPHRAEHCNRQYYIRAGDDFVVPAVSLLRNLFHPQSRPSLSAELTIKWEARHGLNVVPVTYELTLHNTGMASARNSFVTIKLDKTVVYSSSPTAWEAVGSPHGSRSLQTKDPIHPGQIVNVFRWMSEARSRRHHSGSIVPVDGAFDLRMLVCADDQEPQVIELNVTDLHIVDKQLVVGMSKPLSTCGPWV